MFDEDEEEPVIDLTPIIDVVFMLLVFFIMTTTFSKPVLDIILPSSEMAEPQAKRQQELVVTIRSDGRMLYQNREIDMDELHTLLFAQPEALLNLYVDKEAHFEAFVAVVDVARKRPGGHFVISTQPAKGQ